jgi:hypothetical protein
MRYAVSHGEAIEMKKKIGIALIISVILLGTTTLAGMQPSQSSHSTPHHSEHTTLTLEFPAPTLTIGDEYTTVTSKKNMTHLMNEGSPQLPYQTKVLTFPLGTHIEHITITTSQPHTTLLTKNVKPAPPPTPANMKSTRTKIREGDIYSTAIPYPSDWLTYTIGTGLHKTTPTIYLTLHAFPTRYTPSTNELHHIHAITINITHHTSPTPPLTHEDYDLLIISPNTWEEALQPLIAHKENHGITTKLVCLECIERGEHFPSQGRDDAEKVKYFIKNAVEEWGINYVLLVGGRKPGLREKWWCPVRYSHLDDGSEWETSYLSDLYFADIYKYDGGDILFDNWDANGNGVFAEWNSRNKDALDLYPDVYVGRLACRNKIEVQTMVDKIIMYETNTFEEFNRFITVAGDSYNDSHGYIEGELAATEANHHMPNFEKVKIWASLVDLNAENIGGAINDGGSFAYFVGHGNPMSWTTHEPETFAWEEGFQIFDMHMLENGYKLPVVVIGGCHNSQFNVSLLNSFYREKVWKGENAPECWSWWFTRKSGGGAIATIGNTGLGYHGDEDSNMDGIADYVQILDGWLEINFFRFYTEGIDMLGMLHGETLTGYINTFPGNEEMPLSDIYDTKMVQQWCLLGDPSLKLGGYS